MVELLDMIAAVAVFRSRVTIPVPYHNETKFEKILWALLVTSPILFRSLPICKLCSSSDTTAHYYSDFVRWVLVSGCKPVISYGQMFKLQLFSYLIPISVALWKKMFDTKATPITEFVPLSFFFLIISIVAFDNSMTKLDAFIPVPLYSLFEYLLPVRELNDAWRITHSFLMGVDILTEGNNSQSAIDISRLVFTTLNLQISTGFIGIRYVLACQKRKNRLIRLTDIEKCDGDQHCADNTGLSAKGRSSNFRRTAISFVLISALPYLIERTTFDTLNQITFSCTRNKFHNLVRLESIFEHESQMYSITQGLNSSLSPGAYASYMDTVLQNSHELISRNCFALPKMMLLPNIVLKHPFLLVQIFPVILIVDNIKNRFMAQLSMEIEKTSKEQKELESKRSQIEQFDMKNSAFLQITGQESLNFTKGRWNELTTDIQSLDTKKQILKLISRYLRALYWLDILGPMIECALAEMLSFGHILVSEIMVFSRAIQDSIDFILMKSRAEAELASLNSAIEKLDEYLILADTSRKRNLVDCSLTAGSFLSIEGLSFSRGSSKVSIEEVHLQPGVYALTGSNGSGKSSLFHLLMSCKSNSRPIDLEASINIEKRSGHFNIIMPSNDVAMISQTTYWPLHARPIDWILQKDANDTVEIENVLTHLNSLQFFNHDESHTNSSSSEESAVLKELINVKADWFAELSGGQKSKAELVRSVFRLDACPRVLLLDETLAALDPYSKRLVMDKITWFCQNSFVLVIFHESGPAVVDKNCVSANGFFDKNLHFDQGRIIERDLC